MPLLTQANISESRPNPPAMQHPTPTPFPFMTLPTELQNEIIEAVACRFLDPLKSEPSVQVSNSDPSSFSPPFPPSPTSHPSPTEAAQSLQTLFNLSLTSRHLYTLTLPVLYREFSLGYNDYTGDNFPPDIGHRMSRFCETLLTRRHLAALVKSAFLHPKLFEHLGDECVTFYSELARKALGNDEVFDKEGRGIDILMLALMPNLERIVFAGCTWVPVPSEVRVVAWRNLKSLEIVEDYGWGAGETSLLRRYEEELEQSLVIPGVDSSDDDL